MSAERYGAYSVLMSVYSKENPAWLKLAIESIQDQTLPTSDFVLVCDGPLTPELDGVIAEKHCQMGEILMVVRLEKNVGLGNALNEGIKHCRNELVARMDSDDIACISCRRPQAGTLLRVLPHGGGQNQRGRF